MRCLLRLVLPRRLRFCRRRARVREASPNVPPDRLRKVMFLSRVTIGADVALTSVLMEKMRAIAPQASQVLLGPEARLKEIFGGDRLLRLRDIGYQRDGAVGARLTSWLNLIEVIEDETLGLDEAEFAIIDPDSRLTQLGLLPARSRPKLLSFRDAKFRFEGNGKPERVGIDLVRFNLLLMVDESDRAFPWVAPLTDKLDTGRAVIERLRGTQEIVSLSSVLASGATRARGCRAILRRCSFRLFPEGSKLVIDEGSTIDEAHLVAEIAASLAAGGLVVAKASEASPLEFTDTGVDVLIWQGGIGALAGLIAASDLYIGYDSAGQHIAAALGVPVLTVFVNNSTPRFAQRWRPFGQGPTAVLTLRRPEKDWPDVATLVERGGRIGKRDARGFQLLECGGLAPASSLPPNNTMAETKRGASRRTPNRDSFDIHRSRVAHDRAGCDFDREHSLAHRRGRNCHVDLIQSRKKSLSSSKNGCQSLVPEHDCRRGPSAPPARAERDSGSGSESSVLALHGCSVNTNCKSRTFPQAARLSHCRCKDIPGAAVTTFAVPEDSDTVIDDLYARCIRVSDDRPGE